MNKNIQGKYLVIRVVFIVSSFMKKYGIINF